VLCIQFISFLVNCSIKLRSKTSLDQNYIGNASTGDQMYAESDFLNQSIVEIARKIKDGLARLLGMICRPVR